MPATVTAKGGIKATVVLNAEELAAIDVPHGEPRLKITVRIPSLRLATRHVLAYGYLVCQTSRSSNTPPSLSSAISGAKGSEYSRQRPIPSALIGRRTCHRLTVCTSRSFS